MIPTQYYRTVRRDSSLVCYWRLNDNSGTRALDWAAKYNLNGIYNGSVTNGVPLIYDDTAAGSKVFNGSGQSVEIPDAEPLRITGDISIEAWISTTAEKTTSAILNKMNSVSTPKHAAPYNLEILNGSINFELGNGTVGTSLSVESPISKRVPLHIVATCFRRTMKIFIDGVEKGSKSLGAQEVKDLGKPVYIAALPNNSERFNGMIGEVALYKGGFSERKAQEHYSIGRQIIYQKPYYTTYDRPSYS